MRNLSPMHQAPSGLSCWGGKKGATFERSDCRLGPAAGSKRMSAGQTGQGPALDRPDRVDAIIAFLSPALEDVLRRIEGDEFTTTEFIELLQSDPEANAAYEEALRRWGEGERYARMVIHGQVIPGILRRSDVVEWLGFAHGVEDPYAIPARWRLIGDRSNQSVATEDAGEV